MKEIEPYYDPSVPLSTPYIGYYKERISVRKMILKSQKNKDGEVRVYVEVYVRFINAQGNLEKKSPRKNTGIWVLPANWSKSKEEVLPKDLNYSSKNYTINLLFGKVQEFINNRNNQAYRRTVSSELQVFADLFPSALAESKSLTDYMAEYTELRKSNGAARGTWKEFITVKNRLIKYEKSIGKKLNFQDMTLTFSDNFNLWMRSVPYDPATIEKTYTVLKTFLLHYYKRRKELDIQMDDTFKDSEFKKGKKKANPANPLTFNEFVTLSKMNFSSKTLEKTKDRFILQCSTGLRFSDINKITPDKIDKGRIKIDPVKTKETKEDNTIYIDLNKYSRAVLKKYKNDTSTLKISNQKYNDDLENLFEELKWKKRTSHNGRDTFISICIQKRIPVEVILTWTGQSSYSVMRRYIEVPDSYKKIEMNRAFK